MIRVSAALILNNNKILLTQRSKEDKLLPLKWEFPGGKIEEDESEIDCLIREIKEELELNIKVNNFFFKNIHKYGEKEIELNFFLCEIISGTLKLNVHNDFAWVKKEDLIKFNLAEADIPVINYLLDKLL